MERYLTGTGVFEHDRLGSVKYTVRTSSRRVVARWRADMLHLTIPPSVSAVDLWEVLRQMTPRLIACRPQTALYAPGQVFDFDDFRVTIVPMPGYGRRITTRQAGRSEFEIRLGAEADFGSPDVVKGVSDAMRTIARYVAPGIILPRAEMLARKVGCNPHGWKIASGIRILGRCDSRRTIALSYAIVFLPAHLRDYVIYHELAHLSEMNHSAAFHRVCDKYCEGFERRYVAELKAFRFPLV